MGNVNKRSFYSVQEDVGGSPQKRWSIFFRKKRTHTAKPKPPIWKLILAKYHMKFPDFLSDLSPISPEEQVLSEESDIRPTDVSSLADENNDFSRIFHDFPDTSSGVSSLIDDDSADKVHFS